MGVVNMLETGASGRIVMSRPAFSVLAGSVIAAVLLASAVQAFAQSGGTMKMPMAMPMSQKPAHFAPTRQAYTQDHHYLVKLLSLPTPIPFDRSFRLRFAVYDGKDPRRPLSDVAVEIFAGMHHGLKHGFIHSMPSTPKVAEKDAAFAVSGMVFQMMGPWVVGVTVRKGAKESAAYFRLPCCGK
jgi:hypothetical protein